MSHTPAPTASPPSSPPRARPLVPAGRRWQGVAACAVAALVVGGMSGTVVPDRASAATTKVGAGSYTTTLPAGAALPSGCGDLSTNPRAFVTANAPQGAVPTNDWWSSLLFKRSDCSFGEPLMAHPASYDTDRGGLGVSYTTTPVITGGATGVGEYKFPYTRDLQVGVAGLDAPQVRVDGWTDWTVTPVWSDGTRTLRATIGHGLPLSYYQVAGGRAQVRTDGAPRVWSRSGATVGFSVRGHDYVAYAPTGASWTQSGSTFSSTLAGKGYFSVAVLPTTTASTDATRKALATSYGRYAHAVVTGTKLTYSYNPGTAAARARYTFTTTRREGSGAGTVVALYPHQWKALKEATPIGQTYVSPRGAMKTLVGATSFLTSQPFRGVLPEVPAVATSRGADRATLAALLAEEAADPARERASDTYWAGKGLGRAARIAEIADQVGSTTVRDKALGTLRRTLTDWLTASAGEQDHLFHYDRAWGTLIGYDASYGSDAELNDHHFHYGYFVAAAATLAKFDPAWAATGRYGGMVDLLVRDANNYDRSDARFPYLRDFDIYAGHDWASGHGAFGSGNNQESSSEGMNFAGALVQWGQATGNTKVRNAGIHLYTTQAAAIREYWFDVGGTNFPKAFPHGTVGMVWGDGGAYSTWFTAEPEKIQGINQLPITGSHFYLGHSPSYVRANYAEVVRNRGSEPTVWQDILWEYLALGDPAAALAKYRADPGFTSEEGESRAHTFHWIRNLAALGTVDTAVTANHPMAMAFRKAGKRTYVVANVSTQALTVTFSDGRRVKAPAGRTVAAGAQSWSGGKAGGVPTPPPTAPSSPPPPAASASPTVTPTAPPTGPPTATAPPSSGATRYLRTDGTLGAAGSAGTVSVAAARGTFDGTPHAGRTFTATGVTGRWTGTTAFDLAVDAGTGVGNATQVRISYDRTGDGSADRVETYRYFATDPVPGYEHHTQGVRLLSSSGTGTGGDLTGGTVTVQVWSAIGNGPTTLGLGSASRVVLPLR
ncbi:Endoglucanase Acf2 [Friedmanniella luteola]|uniref:glucan endo-1,3-beta-D-glucosidase n=1 Tax=Friedmanniella luteola TaxID=546871 RepID=A0A1H1YXC5_9ACTN|nr:glycosyl hydrolase [Friedmanniella luteola]SDT26012.1 Endoglucanase Acf2 [Friedmanniella luteola]